MGNNEMFLAHPRWLQKLGLSPVPEDNHSQVPETLFLTTTGGTPQPRSRGPVAGRYFER